MLPPPARTGWHHAPDARHAARLLPGRARVLLTSGRKDLMPFFARQDCVFFLRTIEQVRDLPSHVRPVLSRPPFSLDTEQAFLSVNRITHLVTKNAGGDGTAKLDAADALDLTTIMIDRPAPPDCTIVETVDDAVAWLRREVVFAP